MTARNDGLGDLVCEERLGSREGGRVPGIRLLANLPDPTPPRACSKLILEADYQGDNQVNSGAYSGSSGFRKRFVKREFSGIFRSIYHQFLFNALPKLVFTSLRRAGRAEWIMWPLNRGLGAQ